METALSHSHDISNINVLKQVVTDPDYAARESFLSKASPKSASVSEQKARALNKLAAYNQSASILKLVKSRLSSDAQLQKYMVDELNKSGTDLGSYMA